MVKVKFSVLMSVYKNENPEWFRSAVKSVAEQTVKPDEILIVQDGMLSDELYSVCDELKQCYPVIRYLKLDKNYGLGMALHYGVKACKNELIARMDTDDIAVENRFELQLQQFIEQPDLAICGGNIVEFYNDINEIVSTRTVPCTMKAIVEYCKSRNPFNHMTVMFRKSAVLAAGNYQTFHLMEDYYLWYRMIKNNFNMCNLDTVLVNVRVGNGMYQRRGGVGYFFRECTFYRIMLKDGFINYVEFFCVICGRLVVRLLPGYFRKIVYRYVLHQQKEKLY